MADDTQAAPYRPLDDFPARLPELGDPVAAADFPRTILRWRNDRAAADVGLATLDDAAWIDHFGRFTPLPGNLPQPLALRYHGHQFGVYNPDLGDGRGFLFAQMRDGAGRRIDLGTKGSGQTPYSRFGDGRLTLKGAVRELLATEMLEALGVETSRTFSIIETGEALHRGDEPSPTRSAVLVRMSHGHIRIGTFQRLAAINDAATMERLVRWCLTEYAGWESATAEALPADEAAAVLLASVVNRTAATVASYTIAGFVHGVLNSDNVNISGESFDYGPWRFTPLWDPAFVAAYFDEGGRYAFGQQAAAVHWNCGQLAVALRLLAPSEPLIAALDGFGDAHGEAIADRFCWRLGITRANAEDDRAMVIAAERYMRATKMPIDDFYVQWGNGHIPASPAEEHQGLHAALAAALGGRRAIRADWWLLDTPQSMHIEEVEAIWAAIDQHDDWNPLYQKVTAVRAMGAALGQSR